MAGYDEMESRWLLPAFMRHDPFDAAMCGIVDEFGADAAAATRGLGTWERIGEMGEGEIDSLAEELSIPWYDKAADLESKRSVVRSCKLLQAKLGTKWGIEQVMSLYFTGGGVVTEWFDYEEGAGEPGHFRIEAECFAGTAEEAGRFLAILSRVKRKSAVLDKVLAVIAARASPRPCAWLQEWRVERTEARRDG